jgi:sortase A
VYSNKFTLPDGLYYSDGSIGMLSVPKLGVSAKVYEDESLENLKKGIGHFKSTSCWDGNVGFAAHNRGASDYFGQIHTLNNGDKIIYTTKLGMRTYEVYYVGTVDETDLSRLGRTEENIVTLYTCVRDMPALRVCVQARQVSQ